MKFTIDELEVYFPFKLIYKEQYEYMKFLKNVLDEKRQSIVEMPTGTGKTISLFALCLAYKQKYPDKLQQIIYCTRTISQLEKATEELKYLGKLYNKQNLKIPFCTVISARRSLCIHPEVRTYVDRDKIDSECKKRTVYDFEQKCNYFQGYVDNILQTEKPQVNILNLEDLMLYGQQQNICPYYASRTFVQTADMVICNYPYILDNRVNGVIMQNVQENSILIIDEAHNIDDVCLESKTVRIDQFLLESALKNLDQLKKTYQQTKDQNFEQFQKEYNRLVNQIPEHKRNGKLNEINIANKVGLIPGNIRKVSHFFSFLRRLLGFLKNIMLIKEVVFYTPQMFKEKMQLTSMIEESSLKYCSERLNMLVRTLRFEQLDELVPLNMVLTFAELLGNYDEGFKVIYEPYYDTGKQISPLLSLVCLDSSYAMKTLQSKFYSMVLTSGTISPMNMYASILGLQNPLTVSVKPRWLRNPINPLVVTKSSDYSILSSAFVERGNTLVSKNYGQFLIDLARVVPDGIVTFFPSYSYMEEIVTEWKKLGIIEDLLKHKLLFIETKNQAQTSEVLQNYRKACERGRGGVFLCVARGKVAEGVDFKDHLGRCALIIGVPFQYTKSRALLSRVEYLEKKNLVQGKQFILFDAMKQAAQCLGRVVRGKMDYGIMILADNRYNEEKISALPAWIKTFLKPENLDLQTPLAIGLVKKFFTQMAHQPTLQEDLYYSQKDFLNQQQLNQIINVNIFIINNMPRRSKPIQHPLSTQEKISNLVFYEEEVHTKKCTKFTIQNLTKFYSDLVEFYDNIKDPITLYFKEKIQILLSSKTALQLLDDKVETLEENEYQRQQRRTQLTFDTKKELRSKMVDFNLKLSHAQNTEEDQKSIKNLLTNHQENYNKVHEHMKKELHSQEDMFRKKMEKRRERSMSRTLNKSKSKNKFQKSNKNLTKNPPIKKTNILDSLQKTEKKDNPFEK